MLSYKIWQRLVCVFAWTRSRHDLHTCFCPTTTGLVGWLVLCVFVSSCVDRTRMEKSFKSQKRVENVKAAEWIYPLTRYFPKHLAPRMQMSSLFKASTFLPHVNPPALQQYRPHRCALCFPMCVIINLFRFFAKGKQVHVSVWNQGQGVEVSKFKTSFCRRSIFGETDTFVLFVFFFLVIGTKGIKSIKIGSK